MALKQQIDPINYTSAARAAMGITPDMTEFYIRIDSMDIRDKQMIVRADFFHRKVEFSKDEENEDVEEIITRKLNIPSIYATFSPDETDEAVNHKKQAYLFLKTLPEFADCEDC